jgi:4-hydroxy-tetrahydrodipicolinate reductase
MNHMTQVASSHSASMHAVAVAGASGRMGHMLIEAIANAPDCRLTGALDLASSLLLALTLAPPWAKPVAS